MAKADLRLKPSRAARIGQTVASLDIGSSKITCLIGRYDPQARAGFSFLGGGRQQSRGFKDGSITDMEALERSIRLAVEDAERQAGERIDSVVLGVTGARVTCEFVGALNDLGGREVTSKDLKKLHAQALGKIDARQREILTAHPVLYRLDEQDGITDPIGMIGQKLSVLLSVISAPQSLVRNLVECVGRAHLNVDRLIPSALASGAGTLIDDEVENGAICIDMGSGVTTACAFVNGVPAWLGVVPAGGAKVTGDLAQGIGTTFAAAERMKTIYGNADLASASLSEKVEVARLGDDGRLCASHMTRGELAAFIAPRIDETFEYAAGLIAKSELKRIMPRRTVLTGGGSLMPGVRDVASRVLGQPVRLGKPVDADVLGETHASPVFSTAAGLLSYESRGFIDVSRAGGSSGQGESSGKTGLVNKLFRWLNENF
ncbi:MAG: cell division protein FtsA [Henriciella sp.]|uniref:cell division protein FtsA n=1 Tax=Henriciella sp. TaxID=1968823 RepID=UPI000C11AFE1|nr:cell division protein FtsA [Henriciella sp.]MAN74515.1 cell division protein FtsA [Henriciella sp.]MBF32626.1 cell division protein FtsA [Hyphomonadaceae bacterium]PHR81432.1 MAG: cell division protein FtsA [Henriciella sp.]|tara:strand:+ start:29048 stop:30343 length:1296 start_codon:yes stop_codon:yes gene_type:complete